MCRATRRTSSDGVGDADPHLPERHPGPVRSPVIFAAASASGDVGAGTAHRGPGTTPGVDRVAQRDVDERAVRAHVAHRGDARPQGRVGVGGAEQRVTRRRAAEEVRRVAVLDRAHQVRVEVDESRQDRGVREVEHVRAGGTSVGGGENGGDPLAFDHHRAVGVHLAGHHVDEPAGSNQECHDGRA